MAPNFVKSVSFLINPANKKNKQTNKQKWKHNLFGEGNNFYKSKLLHLVQCLSHQGPSTEGFGAIRTS